jgi:membrane-bound lytic murein transglycosylase D
MNRWIKYLLAWMVFLIVAPACAQSPLLEAVHTPKELSFCEEKVPLTVQEVKERFEKEMMLSLWDRPQVILWLKRAPRYLDYIARQLKINKLPEDLQYLAIAESALRPHAGSSKGAIGFWQLLPETARAYGLTVDDFVDERRKLETSTRAALSYLSTLHDRFSSWTLAAAAFNMGEEGLEAEILEQNTKDFYKLYLPLETQRFIFRILAAKLIMQHPGDYGFDLKPDELYPPISCDTVDLDCFDQLPIRLVAQAAGTSFKTIKDLNPQLRGHYLREGHHEVCLPTGTSDGFLLKFNKLVEGYDKNRDQYIYVVKPGDSLSGIAEKFNVPLAALIIWNRIDFKKTIHPGERLVIYPLQLEQIDE